MIDLTALHRRWIFTLEIAGLMYRYTSHRHATPAAVQGHPTERSYQDLACITNVSSMRSRIDLTGGVAEHGPVTVTLGARSGHAGNPDDVFSALGRNSATTVALATSSLPVDATLPFDLTVDRDLSAIAPGEMHIGAELLYISAAGGTDPDPDDADPYTVTISARGLGGTRIRAHVADPDSVDFPILTAPEVVFWRTRPARLLVEDARNPGDPIEVFRGFIDSSPDPNGDGTVAVELAPLTTLLDKAAEIRAPASKSKLVDGYHLFADGAASVFEVFQRQNELRGNVRDGTAVDSLAIDVGAEDAAQYSASFDPSRTVAHPRAGSVSINQRGRRYQVDGTAADGGADDETLVLADGPDEAVNPTALWGTRPACEAIRAEIIAPGGDPEILTWPGRPEDGLDGTFGRITDQLDIGDHTGVDGAAFGIRLDSSLVDRVMRVQRNVAATERPFFPIVLFDDARDASRSGRRYVRSIAELWPEGVVGPIPTRWPGAEAKPLADTEQALWYPIEWARRDRSRQTVAGAEEDTWFYKGGSATRANEWIGAHAIANAFYQRGEPYILVEDDVDISDGRIAVRVKRQLNTEGSGRTFDVDTFGVEVTDSTPVVLPAGPRVGETVYRLTLAHPQDVRCFGVWTAPRVAGTVEIFGGAQAETVLGLRDNSGSTIGEALEWLLMSPATLALTEDDVDVRSLHRYQAPWLPSFDLGALSADPDLTFGDVISSITRMTGTALIMRTANGRTRLTRTHVGIEIATEVAAQVAAGDWASSPAPKPGRDDDIINQVVVNHGFGHVEGDPTAFDPNPVTFNDQASTVSHDERRPAQIDDYSGLIRPSPEVDLAAMAQRIFRTFGEPRRTFKGKVGTYKGVPLGVGAVAMVTSPHLRAYKLPKGVVNAISRVVEQDLDLWRDGCDLVLVHFGSNGGGWAPTARVAEVIDANTVRCDANAYSDVEHPATGLPQEDLDPFSVGQTVKCEPYHDMDGGIERVVEALDRDARTVKFDGAHALAVGDMLIPAWRPNAPEAHRLYAYLGDGESNPLHFA